MRSAQLRIQVGCWWSPAMTWVGALRLHVDNFIKVTPGRADRVSRPCVQPLKPHPQ